MATASNTPPSQRAQPIVHVCGQASPGSMLRTARCILRPKHRGAHWGPDGTDQYREWH